MTTTKRYLAPLFVAAILVFAGAACSSDGDGGGSAAGFCDTLKKLDDDGAFDDSDFDEDSMKKAGEAFKELEASAPAEIKADVKTIADATTALADIDFTDTAALEELEKNFDEEKLDAASENIEKYAKDNCDIDLSE